MRNLHLIVRGAFLAALLIGFNGGPLRVSAQETPVKKPVKGNALPVGTVFVGGAVLHPGPMDIKANERLSDVLSKVIWDKDADLSEIRISYRENVKGVWKQITKVVHFYDYLHIKPGQVLDEANNPVVNNRDRIFVGFKVAQKNGPA